MPKIAFDLDETLGVPLTDGRNLFGWQLRPGCSELLERIRQDFAVCLWSVAGRQYVDKALSFGLEKWFKEVYTWDELPGRWKDIRRIGASFLVDDSKHHRDEAARQGLGSRYIVVPAYGSPKDNADPLAWIRLVEAAISLSA